MKLRLCALAIASLFCTSTLVMADESSVSAPPAPSRHAKKPKHAKPNPAEAAPSGFSCDSIPRYCKEMDSCEQAMFALKQCGRHKLDRDNDGIPCENVCD